MKLFILKRFENVGWDETNGMVIRAVDEKTARALANVDVVEEELIWDDPEKTTCSPLSCEGEEEIILTDYNAG